MAKTDDTKKKTGAKPTAATGGAKRTAAPAKSTAPSKAAPAKTAAKKTTARAAAPAKRVVARPVTRVARPAQPPRPREEKREQPKREKPQPRALPTAPEGSLPLVAADGSASGSVALPEAFAARDSRAATLFQAFLAGRANARQATSATKNRARVAGGGAKPWRQKGTGRARQGSIRSPLWRHGGVVFGPNGRRYEQRIPEKMRRAAFGEAVGERVAAGRVVVFEDITLEGERARTRDVAAWLGRVGDTGRTVVVSPQLDERLGRAMANLPDVELRTPMSLRLAEVLAADTLLVARPALDALAARATAADGHGQRAKHAAVTA